VSFALPSFQLPSYLNTNGLRFHPELLGISLSSCIVLISLEVLLLRLVAYLWNLQDTQMLDLFAYSGYKFVG
jgi:hypothetical protein